MKNRTKFIFASVIGNALEFYDFYLYGVMTAVIAREFFPSHDPIASLLGSFVALAAGYFLRPIGAVLFGHIGDRLGRKTALTLSVILMAIPTVAIGLLPTHAYIGVVAPIILVGCRLLQGVCAGGEYNGAAIFIIEHAKPQHAAFTGSLVSVTGGLGALIASGMGAIFLNPSMPGWAWRIPFLLGGVLGLVGLYIRRKLNETPDFEKIASNKERTKIPALEAIKNYPLSVICCIGGAALSGALSSTFIVYLYVFTTQYGDVSVSQSLLYNTYGITLFVLCAPLGGYLADKFGHAQMMAFGILGIIFGAYPAFYCAKMGTPLSIVIAQSIICLFSACFIPTLNAFMSSLFPTRARYSGVAIGYGFGMALLGGTMPMFATMLIRATGDVMMPAYYLMTLGCVGLALIYLGVKQQKKVVETTTDTIKLKQAA